MCGRYALYGPKRRVLKRLGVEVDDLGGLDDFDMLPRDFPRELWNPYNLAPTQGAPVVAVGKDGLRHLTLAHWGFVPSWTKERGQRPEPINARIETAATNGMFRHAFRRSRVLVPACGFFEWKPTPAGKQPHFIRPSEDDGLFAFGGLIEHWQGLSTFAILVTEPNELVAPIHNRMPLIICPENYSAWLDPAVTDPDAVHALAAPFPAADMRAHPVGKAVGSPAASGSHLVEPVDI